MIDEDNGVESYASDPAACSTCEVIMKLVRIYDAGIKIGSKCDILYFFSIYWVCAHHQ